MSPATERREALDSLGVEEGILHLDDAAARRLLLVRAIEDVDAQGRVLGEPEREQLEREALEASRPPGGGLDFAAYLQERARRVLGLVEMRQPRLAALQQPEAWRPWLLWGLPLAACLLGAAIDRIENPQRVNMLSPALLGVLAWNIVVYLFLMAAPLLPAGRRPQGPFAALQRWLGAGGGSGRRGSHLRAEVLARFHQHWFATAGAPETLWWKQLLHLAAAGWAVGLAISIVLGGVVREYRVGWESTLLDARQVHAVLSALFAPVVALLPFEAFSGGDVERMAFRSGALPGLGEARRWVWMYVALLAIVVVLPRALLAAWSGWRRGRAAAALRIDLRDPYFAQLFSRVSPARITFAVVAAEGGGREAWLRTLGEVADRPAPPHGPWTVLGTSRGDTLRVFEVPAAWRPPAATVAAHAGGTAATQAWLHELLGRFKAAARPQESDPVAAALADTDLLVLLPASPVDLQDATHLLRWVAQPALVLVPDDEVPYRSAVQRLGLAADVLSLGRCLRHWQRDAALLDAAGGRIASGKRAGLERLAATWREHGASRFAKAMRLLAAELVRAARDAEETGGAPAGLRQLVNPAEREAAHRMRENARDVLLQRLRAGEAEVFASLLRLYRAGAPVEPVATARLDGGFAEQHMLGTPQAGMAGAATGAAMGAGIDLLAGGLTLGAATALGAMIGGGAAYAAAAWKNRGNPGGPPQVQPGDELLRALAEGLLLAYLAVANRLLEPGGSVPPAWRTEVAEAFAARETVLAALWQQARSAPSADDAIAPIARELEGIARGLLARL